MKLKKYWKELYEFVVPPKEENVKKVDYPGLLPAERGFLIAFILLLIFILLFLLLNQ